jgi:hypothetical protein
MYRARWALLIERLSDRKVTTILCNTDQRILDIIPHLGEPPFQLDFLQQVFLEEYVHSAGYNRM